MGNNLQESFSISNDKNHAAVMIILIEQDGLLKVLFTHRTNTVRTHKDQVALPGGMKEKDDKDLIQTAIRETREEIGIDIQNNEIIGFLSVVESISNYSIQPYICFKRSLGLMKINIKEVERVFFIPLDWILDRANWELKKYQSSDKKERMVVFFKPFDDEVVWGITAQIMVNFAAALNW